MSRPVTLVTGGSRGIGAAVCVRLAADGHDIALGYAHDGWAAEEVAAAVREAGGRCVTLQVDTSAEAEVDHFFTRSEAELGPVTGLVNNAGVTGSLGTLAEADPADLRKVLDVNVYGVLLSCRRAVKDLTANGGGSIVNISSAAATLGSPGEYVHYAASKAAVDALTVGLAKELGPSGIRVNAVAPGTVTTGIHEAMGDPDRPARSAAHTPLGRPGEPGEIAGAVSWLMSPDASYTTGAVLRVAGGR